MSRSVALLLVALIGCGTPAPPPEPPVSLPAPWADIHPTAPGGEVGEADAESVHVAYKGPHDPGVLLSSWRNSVESAGWHHQATTPLPIGAAATFDKDGKELSVMVTAAKDRVDVLLMIE